MRAPRQSSSAPARPRIALFLGAGASRAFGYPMTNQLLPLLLKHLREGTLRRWGYSAEECRVLEEGVRTLMPGIFDARPDHLPLITDVLSLIDHSLVAGTAIIPSWQPRKVAIFRGVIEQVIASLLTPDQDPGTPELTKVADWLMFTSRECAVGVITTNYDIELDLALFARIGEDHVASAIDFGVSWREPNEEEERIYSRPLEPRLSLLKLHGSLNWLKCPLCEHIYVNVVGSIVHWAWEDDTSTTFNQCHCGHRPLQATLVAPSFIRDMRDVNLLAIWRNALDALVAADRWVVIGYSLPPEDVAIRALFIKALQIRRLVLGGQAPEVFVVQGGGEIERQRYQVMFPGAHYHDRLLDSFDLQHVYPGSVRAEPRGVLM